MKILTDRNIARRISPEVALRLAEAAFTAWGERRVQMPPKVYLNLAKGDFRAMPACILPSLAGRRRGRGRGKAAVVGVKWISVYPDNVSRNLPAVNGTLLLSDASTGCLRAILEANVLTALRTGAAGALATRLLASPSATRLLLVGAGVQSAYQLSCHLALRPWTTVSVWSPDDSESERFVARHRANLKKNHPRTCLVPVRSLESAVRSAQVICTCTPSRKPLIRNEWVAPGTHINAIGADAPGKQELETALVRRAKVVVDDWEQASHSGEINVACSQRKLKKSRTWGDLGGLLVSRRRVRTRREDVTVFDSTGLAIQDMIMADYAAGPQIQNGRRPK